MTIRHIHYESRHELLKAYDDMGAKNCRYGDFHDEEIGLNILRDGTEAYNSRIEEIRHVVWESIPSITKRWQPSFAGAFPNVPAFCAGEPASMWSMQEDRTEHTPIRIWVGTGSSVGLSYEYTIKRGATIIAFAQALSELRPVLITPYDNCSGRRRLWNEGQNDLYLSWDLSSSPMIMSEVAASLCEVRVTRGVLFSLEKAYLPSYHGGWAEDFKDEQKVRAILGASEDDLWLGSLFLYDEILKDPIAWVRKHLEKYVGDLDDRAG